METYNYFIITGFLVNHLTDSRDRFRGTRRSKGTGRGTGAGRSTGRRRVRGRGRKRNKIRGRGNGRGKEGRRGTDAGMARLTLTLGIPIAGLVRICCQVTPLSVSVIRRTALVLSSVSL